VTLSGKRGRITSILWVRSPAGHFERNVGKVKKKESEKDADE